MKLLHSADWHLDAPMSGKTPEQIQFLRQELLSVPEKIAKLCQEQNCQLLLLSGDLFDGTYTKESYQTVFRALESLQIPVFIAPGNHDYCTPVSPYLAESWPKNVHIFTRPVIESVHQLSLLFDVLFFLPVIHTFYVLLFFEILHTTINIVLYMNPIL